MYRSVLSLALVPYLYNNKKRRVVTVGGATVRISLLH